MSDVVLIALIGIIPSLLTFVVTLWVGKRTASNGRKVDNTIRMVTQVSEQVDTVNARLNGSRRDPRTRTRHTDFG